MNTKQLLDQNEVWRTRDGMPLRLVDMDPGHRFNTLEFLRRRAAYLWNAYYFCELKERLSFPHEHIFEELLVERERSLTDGPEAWLERRPLVFTLALLVAEDQRGDVVDGEVVVRELPVAHELPEAA